MNEQPTDDKSWTERLGDCTGHHRESMVAVAEGLVIEIPDVAQRLQQAISGGTSKEIERNAHTLKSCLNYITDGEEVELAQQIELCGHENRPADAVEIFDRLMPKVQAWQDRVQHWLDQQQ